MTWQDGFKRAFLRAMVRQGSPVDDKPSYFGWIAKDYERIYKDVEENGIDYERSSWEDSSWDEFKGTFYEGDTRVFGVDALIVTGGGSRYRYRYSGTAGDLIASVLEDDEDDV